MNFGGRLTVLEAQTRCINDIAVLHGRGVGALH